MYAALWRVLPGPWWTKVLILVVVIGALAFALMTWVFPIVNQWVAPQQVTVGG